MNKPGKTDNGGGPEREIRRIYMGVGSTKQRKGYEAKFDKV